MHHDHLMSAKHRQTGATVYASDLQGTRATTGALHSPYGTVRHPSCSRLINPYSPTQERRLSSASCAAKASPVSEPPKTYPQTLRRAGAPPELRQLRGERLAGQQLSGAVHHGLGRRRAPRPGGQGLPLQVAAAADHEHHRLAAGARRPRRPPRCRLHSHTGQAQQQHECWAQLGQCPAMVRLCVSTKREGLECLRSSRHIQCWQARVTLGSKVAKASASGLASISASTATVTAACCSPASRFFTPDIGTDNVYCALYFYLTVTPLLCCRLLPRSTCFHCHCFAAGCFPAPRVFQRHPWFRYEIYGVCLAKHGNSSIAAGQ